MFYMSTMKKKGRDFLSEENKITVGLNCAMRYVIYSFHVTGANRTIT